MRRTPFLNSMPSRVAGFSVSMRVASASEGPRATTFRSARSNVSVLPARVPVSYGTNEDYPRLEADNARLRNQLAGALKENTKLKKDLADAIDDKALLKDLAAKKQR